MPCTAPERIAPIRVLLESRIERGELDLPLLPRVAGKVLSVAGDASADAKRLAGLIQEDQALAGHVLHIANSPAYSSRMRIVSLQQAVARIGMRSIAEIALATSVRSRVFDVPGYETLLASMWREALSSGTWGKEIARSLRQDVESTFLCGLLHRIGRPIVLQLVSDVARSSRTELTTAEMTGVIEEFQVRVGLRLAETWSLPDAVRVAIEFCDAYAQAPHHRHPVAITHVADRFTRHMLDPEALSEQELRALPVFEQLNLYPADIDRLLEQRPAIETIVEAMCL